VLKLRWKLVLSSCAYLEGAVDYANGGPVPWWCTATEEILHARRQLCPAGAAREDCAALDSARGHRRPYAQWSSSGSPVIRMPARDL